MPCTLDPERLVAWLDGDLRGAAAARIAAHVAACPQCRDRAAGLTRQAEALRHEIDCEVPGDVLARLHEALPAAGAAGGCPEVLTLEDVARYLRVGLDDLDRVAADLPAFEIAGQVRVRRTELERWIARREQDYAAQRLRETLARRHTSQGVS